MEIFGDRIKQAATVVGGLNSLAKAIGMPRRTLGDQIGGKFEVKLSFVIEVAKVTGYSVNWLATGEGEPLADAAKSSAQVDAALLERLHDRVASIFNDVGQKPPQRRIAREAANLYNELIKAVPDLTDSELVDATLPQITLSFKRRLEQAAAEPGTGKRSA